MKYKELDVTPEGIASMMRKELKFFASPVAAALSPALTMTLSAGLPTKPTIRLQSYADFNFFFGIFRDEFFLERCTRDSRLFLSVGQEVRTHLQLRNLRGRTSGNTSHTLESESRVRARHV
jgi:hypothetical protein